jgi:hypothetical protein
MKKGNRAIENFYLTVREDILKIEVNFLKATVNEATNLKKFT